MKDNKLDIKEVIQKGRGRTIPVMEIFRSVQGEGSMMGQLATFIRLGGCNLSCPWCDTKKSWIRSCAKNTRLSDIVHVCAGVDNVIITGGEPCIHEELQPLVDLLKEAGHYVCLETNATLPTPKRVDYIVASPKPPEYKIHHSCYYDELKYVVTDELDFDKHILNNEELHITGAPVWLQPNGYNMLSSAARAFEFIKSHPEMTQLRLGIQMHKIFNLE